MKLMKKALAMFLAAVMIFSTMAVGVSAASVDTVELTIKFFRKDGDNYVETTKAKPGDEIVARVYADTSYNAGGATLLLFFDNNFLDYQLTKGGKEEDVDVKNPDYKYISAVSIAEFEDDSACGALCDALDGKYVDDDTAKAYGYKDLDDMLDKVNFITTGVEVARKIKNAEGATVDNTPAPLDGDTFLYEIPFKVNDNDYVKAAVESSMTIPVEFFRSEENYMNATSVSKIVGSKITQIAEMDEFDYKVVSNPASISIESKITFDANGGEFADKSKTKSTSGIIGSSASVISDVPTLAKNAFKGWSATKGGAAMGDADIAALTFGYSDVTFFAVWEALPPSDVKYKVNKYFMDTTGKYGDPVTTEETGKDGSTINFDTSKAVTGFTYDSENKDNVISVTLEENPTAMANINVYYKRNQHNVIYKDENDGQLDKIENVYYGASIPSITTPYAPTGYDVSWTSNPADVSTMPDSDVTYKASLSAKTYNYTFNANDTANLLVGSFPDAQPAKLVPYKYLDKNPADPKNEITPPTGYTFKSWDKEIPSEVTCDMEFEARYEAISYSVTYKVNHVEGDPTENVVSTNKHIGDKFNIDALPVVAGKQYTGWVCNGTTYAPDSEFTMPASDVVFEATESKTEYSYTFKAETADGTVKGKFADDAATKTDKYYYGETPSAPATKITAPEGYEFVSWTPDIPSTVTESKTFNATYKLSDYTVTYKVNHVEGDPTENVVFTNKHKGDKFNVNSLPEVAGKNYTGWVCNGVTYAPGTEFTMPASNVVFEATEGNIEYTYTFNAANADSSVIGQFEGGKTSVEAKYFYNATPDTPAAPTAPKGYEFEKWSPEVPEKVTESKTFNAVYKAINYSITYEISNAPDGVSAPAKAENKHYNDSVTIAKLPVVGDGYTIDGWYNNDEKVEPESDFTMPAENVTLTATVSTKKFNITFDPAGGDPVEPIEVEYGKPVNTLPDATRDDYDFNGWVDGDGAPVSSIDSMPANDVALTATWVRKEYKITYKYGKTVPEGAPELPAEDKSISGKTINVEGVPSLDGWSFDGWKYNGVVVTTFEMPKSDVEIIGEWRRKGGNLSFYLAKNEDGTPVGDPYDTKWVDEGESVVIPEIDPEQTGSTFLGWVDKDGGTLPATMPDADVDAFAKFELNSHKVTYYDSDGTTLLDQYDVTYGSEIPVANNPTPPAHEDPENYEYLFAGWTPANTYEYMPDQDLEFKATYVSVRLGSDHTATYMSDGKVIEVYVIHSGDPMKVPEDPTKFGKTFIGWSPEVPAVMPDYDVTFEAQWETNVDFNPVVVGGVVVAGAAVAAIATAAAVNTALITGAAIVGGVVVITGIHHVIEHSYNVTYKANGEVYRTFRIIEGAKIIVPKDPTKEGAEFKGWNPEVPERMPAEDIVFEAVWSDTNSDNPATGSVSVGLAAFAAISSAAVAAYLVSKKKKEDEE